MTRPGCGLSLFNEDIRNALISQERAFGARIDYLFTYVQNVDRTIATGVESVFERKNLWIEGFDLTASLTYLDPHISSSTQSCPLPRWASRSRRCRNGVRQ